MVMNMFDTGLVATPETDSNKAYSNNLLSFNDFNIFGDGSLFEDKAIQSHDVTAHDTKSMFYCNDENLSFTSNFLFNNQPLNCTQRWSNGESANDVTNNINPILRGFDSFRNSLLCGSPNGQSRIMSFINGTTPPFNITQASMSPANAIESMKVSDFLNHPSGSFEGTSAKDNYFNDSEDTQVANHTKINPITPCDQILSDTKDDSVSKSSSSDSDHAWPMAVHGTESSQEPTAAPAMNNVKNAWSKPLKFDTSNCKQQKSSPGSVAKKAATPKPNTPSPKLETKTEKPVTGTSSASVGSKVSELDDFSLSDTDRKPVRVQKGGFQVVGGGRKSKSQQSKNGHSKNNSTKNNNGKSNTKTSVVGRSKNSVSKGGNPPLGVEKCHYGGKCLFGVECSRWHSTEDQAEFNKQKLPNGTRKCPWGAKCFRKEKCINFHSKEEIEQFKQ